jgi:hypothetical protein
MRNRGSRNGFVHALWLVFFGCVLIAVGVSLGGHRPTFRWWPWHDGDMDFIIEDPGEGRVFPGGASPVEGSVPSGLTRLKVRLKAARLVISTGGGSSSAGSWRAAGFGEGSLSIHADSGSLSIEETGWRRDFNLGENVEWPVVEIVLPEGVRLERCELSLGAGSIVFSGAIEKSARVSTGVGSVELTVKGVEDDFRIDYERGLGSVEIDGAAFSGAGSGFAGRRDAGKRIDLSAGLGAIRLRFSPDGE